jgi:putative methionine-R-sulfoxide reductase with GAF domain
MQHILDDIVQRFGADTGTIHLLENDILVLRAHIGLPPHVVDLVGSVPMGRGMAGLSALRNEPVRSCNIQTDTTGVVRSGAKATGVNGAIVVPIRDAAGQVRGTLGIGIHRDYEYTADETARLLEEAKRLT